MSHYYKYDPTLKSNKKDISYTFKGEVVHLVSDSGVFSKERVDFGTNVLLNSLSDELLDKSKTILDVGCGYGAIGVCIAKKYPNKNVLMIDINDRCVELVLENINNNKLNNAKALKSNVYQNIVGEFDLIISNPPIRAGKDVVFEVVSGAKPHLTQGGALIVVIQKKQGAPSLEKKMQEVYGNCDIVSKEKGYYILKSERKE